MSARGNRKSGEVFPMVRVSDCHTSKKGYPHLSADHHSGRSGSIQVKNYQKDAKDYFNPFVYLCLCTPEPWNWMFMVTCIVNSSFYNKIFLDFMKRGMLLLWSFQDIHHFEKIWIGSIQIFQERYKKCKQKDLLYISRKSIEISYFII